MTEVTSTAAQTQARDGDGGPAGTNAPLAEDLRPRLTTGLSATVTS